MADLADRRDAPRRSVHPAVRALVVIGGAAALLGAGVARFVTRSPMWLDEALTVNTAGLRLGDIGSTLRHDGHPPLFYWLLHGWMSVFGDGDLAVRSLAGLFGILALPLAYFAGRRVGGTRTGLATAFVVAWSPFAIRYSTEARMYSLAIVGVFAGHLLLRRAVDERAAPPALLAGVAVLSGLLLLSHYWSIFLLAATVVVLLLWGRRVDAGAVALRLVIAVAAGGLLFLPWLPAFLEQAAHTATPWATAARPTVVVNETLIALGGGDHAEAGLLAAAVVALALLGLLGRRVEVDGESLDAAEGAVGDAVGGAVELATRGRPALAGEAAVLALTLGLGAVVGVLTDSTYAGRYAAVVFPLLALLVGRGIALLPGWLVPAGTAVTLLLFGVAGTAANVLEDRTQAGDIAEAIAAGVGPDDAVVACPDQLGPALRRAMDGSGLTSTPLYAYPTLTDGRFVDWYDYEARNDAVDPTAIGAEVLGRVAPTGRIWVAVNGSYRTFTGDCEALLGVLGQARGVFREVVADGTNEFFEAAALVVFEPAP